MQSSSTDQLCINCCRAVLIMFKSLQLGGSRIFKWGGGGGGGEYEMQISYEWGPGPA